MNAPSEIAQASIRQRLDHHELARLLPYKSPWLLIDRVTAWSEEGITVHKAISGAEANMAAHLSQGPSIMPGVLQIEFVNQAVMLLMILLNMSGKRSDNLKGGTGILAKTRARFHSPRSSVTSSQPK